MEFKDLIMARRSVRAYEEGIGHEALVSILKEAQRAPSWRISVPRHCRPSTATAPPAPY